MEDDVRLAVTAFDAVSPAAALELMRPVCASPVWLDAMVARRPHGTLQKALDVSDTVVAGLGWQQVEKALAAEPASAGHEQSGTDGELATRLHEAGVAYEQKFGYGFLLCATGMTGEQILAALTERLGHDRAQEQIAVRRELAAVARLRLTETLV